MLTPEEIAQGLALEAKATKGPWGYVEHKCRIASLVNCGMYNSAMEPDIFLADVKRRNGIRGGDKIDGPANAALIVYARNHLADLLAAAQENARLRKALVASINEHLRRDKDYTTERLIADLRRALGERT